MSSPDRLVLGTLPEPVARILEAFEDAFEVGLRLSVSPADPGGAVEILYTSGGFDGVRPDCVHQLAVMPNHGNDLELQVAGPDAATAESVANALGTALTSAFEASNEIQFFTYELSERFEEINLLYSISETLGSTLDLDSGARKILKDVRDVMGAKRGSLWVHLTTDDALHLIAEVGDDGRAGPISTDQPDTITSMVFREGRSIIATRGTTSAERDAGGGGDSFLSVPIRYTPASGESRTVGVINLIGRQDGSRFNASNQKLLSAIASQVGAAIENNRLVQESLSRERMAREMELAHDLQMKLLPDAAAFYGAEASGRVQPTEQVGGDFYQLFKLSDARVGVMLGDVSLHGFASALIMTLAMSAAGIYARESDSPAAVLRGLDDALSEELETTEMFLSIFYGVLDPQAGRLVYSNAGHPHAFVVRPEGSPVRLVATDPPLGFAGPDAYGEESIDWSPGEDLLLLFTDGLSDNLMSDSGGSGEALVLDAAVRNRFRTPADVVEALFELTSDSEPRVSGDDRTALVVRV